MEDRRSGRLVRRLIAAEAVTRVGDSITMVALPLTAVLVLDASPAQLALIGAAQALPILLLTLPAGAWIDRRPRRWPIIVAADLARAALILAVPAAAMLGMLSIPLLALVALLVSIGGTVFDLAYAGWVPRVVTGEALHRTNARLELARASAAASGPALGGFLVGLLSAPFALIADAVSFIASAGIVVSIRRDEPDAATSPQEPGRLHLLAGIRFVAGQPLVRAVTATAGINNLTRAIAMSIAILFLVDVATLSGPEVGLAFAVGHTGFIVGALASRPLTRRIGMGSTMQLGVALFGPSMLLFAMSPPDIAGATFAMMVFAHGFGIAVHNVNQVTLRQLLTPDALRARVAAVFRLVIFGAIPVGTVLGGVVGEVLGLRAALIVSGAGLLLGSLPYALVRVARIRSLEQIPSRPGPSHGRSTGSPAALPVYRWAMPRDPNIPDAFDVYTLVLLRRPDDAPDMPEHELDTLQARHLAYRAQLRRDGVLVANGPLGEQSDPSLRGLSILSCDLDEARRLSDLDPSVQAGRLTYDVFEWWVAAGTLAFPGTTHAVGERRAMPDD